MPRRIVLIPLIRGPQPDDRTGRSDLGYAPYGVATWKVWCDRHDAELLLVTEPEVPPHEEHELAPTIQRWIAACRVIRESGPDVRLAVVDADTMVRWDMPDLFAVAGRRLAAVRGRASLWIYRSIRAYQSIFPDVSLEWWQYFNAGVVVLNAAHVQVFEALIGICRERWRELQTIQRSGNYGTDQTLLNFVVKREHEPVTFLPPTFNLLHCFPVGCGAGLGEAEHVAIALTRPGTFDFIEMAYVWHFTSVVACRREAMHATWQRVREHYRAAEPDAVLADLLATASRDVAPSAR